MKRIISWIVLFICFCISAVIAWYIVHFGLLFASNLYDSSRGIFWLIIILGGSFGLGIAYGFSLLAAQTCFNISQWISPSKKGVRYKVLAIVFGIFNLLSIVLSFVTDFTGIELAREVISNIFCIVMCFVLFVMGKGCEG